MNLSEAKPNQKVIIEKINGTGLFQKRLLEMGLIPHTVVLVKKYAPFKDPIEIEIRHYILILRKEEAQKIQVRVIQ